MMAASARISGTTLPRSSNLKRGSIASRKAAACCAARTRAARTRRLAAGFFAAVVAFPTAGFLTVEAVFFWAEERTAALDCAGRPTVASDATKQKSLAAAENRFRITDKPL